MRVGLLGTGPWAAATHAPALAGHPGVEFTGVWGRRPEAAGALAAAHGVGVYADPDALFADADAVAVALPPDVQAELAARAAGTGCHLLLDKPVATGVAAARRVAEAARRSAVASVVFLTLRFERGAAAWISEQAALDGWFTGRAEWLGSVFAEDTDSPYRHSPWRRERGALWDVGPHALSVLLPVLGEVTQVTASRGPGDTTHLLLRHGQGASSTVTLSLTAPPGAAGMGVELRGTRGVSTMPTRGDGPVAAFGHAVDALLDAVRTGVPHPCDARFGLRLTEILAVAERSLT
ncbi:Gfo/Idh/MocA family protein [Streptomyces sp. GC420]|uniref:Gfo/Idh/MocA family protein n=1 Tax=Streptomyces sp. GC420 TaxID=2697568 RepID=UPI001415302C|nr:Gfo/Idh/MocA family oxidoreductase [Streptomyces sp. GC420]NBM17562.1 Gfo/Idh/MocA family oxidoreductase [Streptomyces sp. GC420]